MMIFGWFFGSGLCFGTLGVGLGAALGKVRKLVSGWWWSGGAWIKVS